LEAHILETLTTMPYSYEGLIKRIKDIVDECEDTAKGDALHREIDDVVSHIKTLETKVKSRGKKLELGFSSIHIYCILFLPLDETIRELRRTVMLELLSLQTNGVSDSSRYDIQKKTIDRLQHDEQLLIEWRQKAKTLENEIEQMHKNNSELRASSETDKRALRQRIDELEFITTEMKEHVKVVESDSRLLKIVMIGKDAIVEKQYQQLQEKDCLLLEMQSSKAAMEAEKVEGSVLIASLREEIDKMQMNKERNYLLERVEMLNHDNLNLKKTVSDYKEGYSKLTDQCQMLTDELKSVTESLEHAKRHRRKSKCLETVCPPIVEEQNNTSVKSDEMVNEANSSAQSDASRPVGDSGSGKRRKSSRLSIIRRKSDALATRASFRNTDEVVVDNNVDAGGNNSPTRIQMRRLRSGSVVPSDANPIIKMSEDKQCQVNIESSQYANVRMGNEEEVVVKALYRRIAELENVIDVHKSEADQLKIELSGADMESRKKHESTQLHSSDDFLEYQAQNFDDFLLLKADRIKLKAQIEALHEDIRALQSPVVTFECKSTQCDSRNFVTDATSQATVESKEFSTQTRRPTPMSNHLAEEDPFYSYIFSELLAVCKHVVSTHLSRNSVSAEGGRQTAATTIASCKDLMSSLVVLRRDLFEEMQYRYAVSKQFSTAF